MDKSPSPPNYPKIEIKKYSSKLSDNVKILSESNIIKDLVNNKILIEISNKLKLSKTTLENYTKNKKYPLFFLKELNKIVLDDIFFLLEQNNPIFFSK